MRLTASLRQMDLRINSPLVQSLEPGARSLDLQLDRLNFRYETVGIVLQERGDNVEHGVAEAADVQDEAVVCICS